MDNLRGSLLMIVAMAGFALEDTFIKFLSVDLSVGQILFLSGFGAALVFGAISLRRGDRFLSGDFLNTPVLLRNLGELIAALGYVTALSLIPLSTVAAILQATPLFVTLGAALFLKEQVGWRRWSAIAAGFCGVLLVIRPGLDGFQPAALLVVMAVCGLVLRDLATRVIGASVSSFQLSGYAFATICGAGLIVMPLQGGFALPSMMNWLFLGATVLFGGLGYYAIVAAMRIGEISVVMPFRYTRLLFSLAIGIWLFGERPDWPTFIGAALIICSGLYSILREHRLARANRRK